MSGRSNLNTCLFSLMAIFASSNSLYNNKLAIYLLNSKNVICKLTLIGINILTTPCKII